MFLCMWIQYGTALYKNYQAAEKRMQSLRSVVQNGRSAHENMQHEYLQTIQVQRALKYKSLGQFRNEIIKEINKQFTLLSFLCWWLKTKFTVGLWWILFHF